MSLPNTASNGHQPRYRRILLKLSGEALSGPGGTGIDPDRAAFIATRIKTIHDMGVQVAVVIGAGNLWRGKTGVDRGMDQTTADHMGMIATVMNSLALRDAIEREGIETRVHTAIEIRAVAEPYIRLRAIRQLEKGFVVIIGGGTGNPYFTTDSAAALYAMQIEADLIIKATQVDGIYDSDPRKNPKAQRFDTLTFQEVIDKRLDVMDMTAFTLCQEHHQPIMVVNFWQDGALEAAVTGQKIGTLVS